MLFVLFFGELGKCMEVVGNQRVWKPTVQKADKNKLCSYLHCWITCALLTTLIFHFGPYCYSQCTVIMAPLEGWYGKSQWLFCTFWRKKMTRHHRPNVLVRRQCLMCTMFSSGHHTGWQCCRSRWLGERNLLKGWKENRGWVNEISSVYLRSWFPLYLILQRREERVDLFFMGFTVMLRGWNYSWSPEFNYFLSYQYSLRT